MTRQRRETTAYQAGWDEHEQREQAADDRDVRGTAVG